MILDVNGKLALKQATHLDLAEDAGWKNGQAYSIGPSPAQTGEYVATGSVTAAGRRPQKSLEFNGFRPDRGCDRRASD
jgi:hypothetical protein